MPTHLNPSPEGLTARRGGSAFADRQAAIAAVELLLPTLSAALQSDFVGDSGCLHIVIMDPALGPHDASFEDAILYEFSLPDPKDWDADYRAYARAKARLSWETGRDGHVVQA
ncbi:TPA: hypothetical protein SAP12_005432, partial [Burkholderia multivorans]|nr:hypothetical protein [Burkholderia multivorans]